MTFVIAHRGASSTHRENTLEAFLAARDQGADGVELDVRCTADGALAVHHDAHLADGRAVVEVASPDLPGHVPLLDAALGACSGMGVNIEIKTEPDDPAYDLGHQAAAAVVAHVRAAALVPSVLVTSFDLGAIDRVRALDPSIATGLLTFDLGDVPREVDRAAAGGHQALNPYVGFVDRGLVETAHRAGLAVNVWTVDDPDRIAELADLGVDGVITNVPAVARSVIGR